MSDDIASLVAVLGLSVDEGEWARGQELIEKARKGVEGLSAAHEKAGHKEEGTAKELRETLEHGLETYVGYEGLKTIEELVEHTVSATIQAKHLGERLGITTEAVQSLGYAASVTGASQEALTSGLQRLSFNLQQTGPHAHGANEALRKLGITTESVSADLKHGEGLDALLENISEKFKAMPDGPEKVALAMKLFGRTAGPQLVPLLNEGKDGIKALREEAEELGVTMGEDGVKKAEEFERAQKKLQARWGAVKDAIVMAILPALTALSDGMGKVVAFMRTHEDVMLAFFGAITAAITYLGVSAAIAWLAVLGPIDLIALGIIAIGAGVALLIKHWDEFSDWIDDHKAIAVAIQLMFWPITGLIIPAIKLLVDHWDGIVDTISSNADTIETALTIMFFPIIAAYKAAKWLVEHLEAIGDAVGGALSGPGKAEDFEEGGGGAFAGMRRIAKQIDAPERDAGPEHSATVGASHAETNTVVASPNITIHTGANPDEVKKAVHEGLSGAITDAHHALKKGG